MPRYWRAGLNRARECKAWWRRNPGLMLCGVLGSLAATLALGLLLAHVLEVRGSPVANRAYVTALAALGTSYLAGAAAFTVWAWLLTRVYHVAYFALGLLAQDTPRAGGERLDDAMAASPLSTEEVVVGALWHGLSLLRPPLLVLSLLGGVLVCAQWLHVNAGHFLAPGGGLAGLMQYGWLGALLAGAAGAALHYLCGMLAAALMILLQLGLGHAPRAGLLPAAGAAAWTLFALLLTVGGVLILATDLQRLDIADEDFSVSFQLLSQLGFMVEWGVLSLLALLLSRLAAPLRWFAACAGLQLLYVSGLIVGRITFAPAAEFLEVAMANQLWVCQTYGGLANAGQFSLLCAPVDDLAWWAVSAVRWPILLLLQLLLLQPCFRFATDAVRRRRAGAV